MTPDQEWHWGEGNTYAIEGMKALLLLNGGAAIALLMDALEGAKAEQAGLKSRVDDVLAR
jgi:hypothetical protein